MNLRNISRLGFGVGLLLLSSWRSEAPVLIEPRAYILGAVNDYLGRSRTLVAGKPEQPDKVDEFHDVEQPLLTYVTQLLEKSGNLYSVTRRHEANCSNCHEFQVLESKQVAREINSCYSFRFDSKDWDEQNRVSKRYRGHLTAPRLRDTRSKMSFLAGAYARYGSHQDNIYTISLGNSVSKYDLIITELKALHCQVKSDKTTAGVPTAQTVSFIPTAELRVYLNGQNVLVDSIKVRRNRRR